MFRGTPSRVKAKGRDSPTSSGVEGDVDEPATIVGAGIREPAPGRTLMPAARLGQRSDAPPRKGPAVGAAMRTAV